MQLQQRVRHFFQFITILFFCAVSCTSRNEETRVLVFSKTTGYRHQSISKGIEAIRKLGEKYHFLVDTTENAAMFNEVNLKHYKAVIFLSTTGDVLNTEQQSNFERFIQAGGGFVGIHAAADTEYDWPWYGKLAGAYFESHPQDPSVRHGVFQVVDKGHPATDSLPDTWERDDEFYSFKEINPDIHVLIKIDEKSYEGGTNDDNHPMAWYHEYDGGRAFYTNLGHTDESYADPLYLRHLWGGIFYALGGDNPVKLDYDLAHTVQIPDENRFTKVVLDEKLNEPVELALLPNGNVLFIERHGYVKIYDKALMKTEIIDTIPVSTKYKSKDGRESEAEDGLLGVILDPNFKENHWIYFYYSQVGDDPKNILTRYELNGKKLNETSKKIILEVVVQREQCCHTAGSMAFDENGNLLLATGDNTSPRATAYAPIDERPGRFPWDAQKSSGNTNDLRGKVIRIHPEPDGTYTIPEGNLFPKGMEKTRPEIYGMGMRNPYRISYDKKTGFLYWGDVGPDANKDSTGRGSRGYDEINQARKPGFFGWPYFVGDNKPYGKRDFATNTFGPLFDQSKPLNTSPNNTGRTELPEAQKAFIWYGYDKSTEFPLIGSGSRTAMAGPVFYSADFKNAKRPFPDYYDGKLFIYEWMRGWIMAVTMDKEGNYVSMEQFMPSHKFSNPMDMEFSPDGDLYMLEYGSGWFQGNDNARLIRIEYKKGNRAPAIRMAADKTKGAVPMKVALSSKGTADYDHDDLEFEWTISAKEGTAITTLQKADTSFTFEKPGIYTATLSVADSKGEKSSSSIEIAAGNEPPVMSFQLTKGNKMFFFPNTPFDYEASVNDKEDGNLDTGISPEQISVSASHLKEGFDKVEVVQGHLAADASAIVAAGKKLMDQSDCKSCHIIDRKSIGPTYKQIAEKYKDDKEAVTRLANKVINGGTGVWGETAMAAHPALSFSDASEIVKYILSLGDESTSSSLPAKGTYTPKMSEEASNHGILILRAAYTDKGANKVPAITAEDVLVLKNPNISMDEIDKTVGTRKFRFNNPGLGVVQATQHNSYIGFEKIDMTTINQLVITYVAQTGRNAIGGLIEVHLDSAGGALLGTSSRITPQAGNPAVRYDPRKIKFTIKPVDGLRDVYFVFKNDKIKENQSLFTLTNIQLLSNGK